MNTAAGAQKTRLATAGEEPGADQLRPGGDPFRARYRVVMRKPLVAPGRRGSAFRQPIGWAVGPVLFLVAYVLFGTLSMRGGYYLDELKGHIRMTRIERAELEAEKRRLQAPGIILHRAAAELGMRPADRREFARLPVPQRLARRATE